MPRLLYFYVIIERKLFPREKKGIKSIIFYPGNETCYNTINGAKLKSAPMLALFIRIIIMSPVMSPKYDKKWRHDVEYTGDMMHNI